MKITKSYLKEIIKEELANEAVQAAQPDTGLNKINVFLSDIFKNYQSYGFKDKQHAAAIITSALKPYLS